MNEFIPINLTQIKSDYSKLLDNKFSLILGSPESGKTRLAKHLEEIFPKSKYFTVQNFMELENTEEVLSDLLILDGFDEYRIFQTSKNHTIRTFARKIDKLLNKKIILTCRELDWYGDKDTTALKDVLNIEIKQYFIEPIDEEILDNFLEKEKNIDKEKIYNFFKKGFITTPQLFEIAKKIIEENIENKIDLYEKFVLKSIEEYNDNHKEKNIPLAHEKILEYLGYMSYFYMFSNINSFDEEIIPQISSENFDISIINQLLTSKIFRDKTFVHRTIAEFLCGRYFAKLIENNKIDKILIINRFKNKNFIYTELRATYAWLCAISRDLELIKIDPFYQLIYGENNHFSNDFKKQIIKAIRKYSEQNPYFFDNNSYFLKDELKGFYSEELDEFFIKEIKDAIVLKNHYIYVFEIIFTSNQENLSDNLKEFLYQIMFDNNLVSNFKKKIIDSNIFDLAQHKNILEAIKQNKIKDIDNLLKIALLEKLYYVISIDEIVEVFKLFNNSNMMHICIFLYEMEFENKKRLVLKIEEEIFQNVRNNYNLIFKKWNCIKRFLENFYFELFHTKSADEIYTFLKKVRKFYKDYEEIKVDKGYINKNIKERNEKELQELTNKIFKLYFNDLKFDKNIFHLVYEFYKWFPLAYPSNVSEVIISNIKQIGNENVKKDLFWTAMQHFKNKDKFDDVFFKLSKELGLEDEYEKFKNPKKSKYELKMEEEQKKWELEKQETIKKNNEFFKKLDKEKFLSHFGALDFFSYLILFEKENTADYIDIKIFDEFKNYFKSFIFSGNFIEYVGVDKFVQYIKDNRKIDTVFYTSLCLNENTENLLTKLDDDLKMYLYLLSLKEKNVINICHNDWFIEKIEKDNLDLAKYSLIKVFDIKYNLSENIKKRINDSEFEQLKELFNLILYFDNFVNSYIKVFSFNISKEEMNDLKTIENTKLLEVFEKFCDNQLLSENELVIFYVNIFDRLNSDIKDKFKGLSEDIRFQIFKNFILVFNDETKMPFHEGVQSDIDITRSFVRNDLLQILKESEIQKLLNENISKYWKNLLKWQLAKKDANSEYKFFRIKELKNFIENNGLLDEKDFFEYVSLKIDELIKRIEANEDNEKNLFYNENKPRDENQCRDAFVNLFKDTNFYLVDREQNIENYRVDFEVLFKTRDWKVRVECKKDKHSELFKSIKTQLIENYLKNKLAHYGIYLIFYFGDRKKSIEYIKKEVEKNIPNEWKDKVKVKIINLRKI